MYYN